LEREDIQYPLRYISNSVLIMLEDRLRPRYSGRGQGKSEAGTHLYRLDYSQRSELRSPQQKSPQQRKARAIVAKYKKTVRYAQLYRLKSLVPAVKDKEEASEVFFIPCGCHQH